MMQCASNCLDRGLALRLLSHGVFLSAKVPPITKVQGLILAAEAALDDFVKEFKGLVREALSGCTLGDFVATPLEMSQWFEQERWRLAEPAKPAASAKGAPENTHAPSWSTKYKEVDRKWTSRS